ncbi:MAG: PD-(D/E)XK nuclease family transposase [Leptospiraceae bacterium]|nr:PD-(D/E)XK nuclease family transposase [Leptospiraceae bacterium]
MYNEEKNQYSNFKIQSEQNPIIFLTENFSIRIIELPKLVDGFSKIKAPLDYWIYFMKEAANLKGEEMKTLIKKNPKIKKAINELKFVYLNKKSREYYEMKFKADMDYSNDIT